MRDEFELSRRKMLGALGGVGVASAGAGLGTTAYFSDTESFTGNEMLAGELDMLVDWQQRYWGPPEPNDVYGDPGRPYVNAWPDDNGDGVQDDVPQSFVVWSKRQGYDLDTRSGRRSAVQGFKDEFLADLGDGLDWDAPLIDLDDVKPGDRGEVTLSLHLFDNRGYVRMIGRENADEENGYTEPEPDTEAGGDTDDAGQARDGGELDDKGEALIWADDGDNIYEPRNGEEVDVVVLFDTSCSMSWEDSSAGCNAGENTAAPDKFPIAQEGAKAMFEELLANPDVSGMGLPGDMVPNAEVNVGLIEYGNSTGVKQSLTDGASVTDLKSEIDGMGPGNSTELPTALELAKNEFDGRDVDHQCLVIFGDGQPHDTGNNEGDSTYNYDDWGATYSVELTNELKDMGVTVNTVHYEVDIDVPLATGIDPDVSPEITSSPSTTINLFEAMASEDPELGKLVFASDRERLTCVLFQIARMCAGEVPLFYGSLNDALATLDTSTGGSDISTTGNTRGLDLTSSGGVLLVGNPRVNADPDYGPEATRACLEWSCTYFVGFEWWVPDKVGNEIQGDSLEFELGFETEQCRHNDAPFATADD